MSQPVATVTPETTAADAASRCDANAIGSVVVVADDAPVGIVTSADFVRLLGEDPEPETRTVEAFMSAPVRTIQSDAPLNETIETMQQYRISRLVALDDDDAITGIVTTDDIADTVPQLLHRSRLTPPERPPQYRIRQETAYEHPDWAFECKCASEKAVTVGDTVEFSKRLTEQDVRTFAALSGDTNRLHLDDAYAAGTRFGRRIVHGTLVASLISAALARLPGLTIYVSQDLSFRAPVDIGARVTAVCEVVDDLDRNRYTLTTDVRDADGSTVIEGQAVVLVDPPARTERIDAEAIA